MGEVLPASASAATSYLAPLPEGEVRTAFDLPPTKVVAGTERRLLVGRVLTSDGEPSAAQIVVIPVGQGSMDPVAMRASDSGEFEMMIGVGEQSVAAVADDGRTVVAPIAPGTADPPELELRLPVWGILRGRLVGDATDATVTAMRDPRSLRPDEPAAIREALGPLLMRGDYHRVAKVEGHDFTFEGIEPGTYSLRARSRNAVGRAKATTGSTDVVIAMESSATLTLHVRRDDGFPVTGVIEIAPKPRTGGMRTSVLHAGEITIARLRPGSHELTIRPSEGPVPAPTDVVLELGSNDVTWTLSSESVSISGRVLDAESRTPISNARVSTPRKDWYGWLRIPLGESTTDESGFFTIDVATDETSLFIWHDGYEPKVVQARDAETILIVRGMPSNQVLMPNEELDQVVRELREKGRLRELPGRRR